MSSQQPWVTPGSKKKVDPNFVPPEHLKSFFNRKDSIIEQIKECRNRRYRKLKPKRTLASICLLLSIFMFSFIDSFLFLLITAGPSLVALIIVQNMIREAFLEERKYREKLAELGVEYKEAYKKTVRDVHNHGTDYNYPYSGNPTVIPMPDEDEFDDHPEFSDDRSGSNDGFFSDGESEFEDKWSDDGWDADDGGWDDGGWSDDSSGWGDSDGGGWDDGGGWGGDDGGDGGGGDD